MTIPQIRPAPARLHYAWIIVAISFVAVVVTAGVRATPSVLIVPLEAEFHWSRATISFAVGVNLLLYGAVGPFAAAVMDRFGSRRTMVLALAAAAGQLVFLPAMAQLATDAAWRVMSFVLAATVVAFLPLLALLMRDRPEELGLTRYGEETGSRATALPASNPIAVALRTLFIGVRSRDFWLIAGGYFVCGATTNGLIGTHLIAACVDHGLSEVAGAGLLAATGVFALVGGTLAAGSATAGITGCCCAPITGCAACRCSICRSPSTCRFTACRRSASSMGLIGSPTRRRRCAC